MSDERQGMRARLRKFFDLVPSGELASNFGEFDLIRFAESEVARLSQPAPAHTADTETIGDGLTPFDRAEAHLREWLATCGHKAGCDCAACATARAALDALSAPAQDRATRVVWTSTTDAHDAVADAIIGACLLSADDLPTEEHGLAVYRVTITAERAGKDGTGE